MDKAPDLLTLTDTSKLTDTSSWLARFPAFLLNFKLMNKLPALTIFLGSFLFFGVQPMLGRTLLPAFGGTSAVWTTCLATYQVLLRVGYWYAHRMAGRGREGRSSKVLKFESSKVGGVGTCERSTFNAQRLTSNEEITPDTNALTNYRTNALLWLLLPATSTFLLNAVTAHLSTDVTPIPLLWVALLAAFLVSYIIGFSKIGEMGVLVW